MTPTFSFSREKLKNETVLKSGTIRFFVSVAWKTSRGSDWLQTNFLFQLWNNLPAADVLSQILKSSSQQRRKWNRRSGQFLNGVKLLLSFSKHPSGSFLDTGTLSPPPPLCEWRLFPFMADSKGAGGRTWLLYLLMVFEGGGTFLFLEIRSLWLSALLFSVRGRRRRRRSY